MTARRFIDFTNQLEPNVTQAVLKFFKGHKVKAKELIYVDTEFEDSDLPTKIMSRVSGVAGTVRPMEGSSLVTYTEPMELALGMIQGKMWFVLHRTKALDL